jgi:parallel beta-helix repeat protein
MSSCNNNKIIDNNLQNSNYGAYLTSSNNNILYHNNLKGNTLGNGRDDATNDWDNGLEGNWWDDNPNPGDADGNGIYEVPYSGTGFTDNYPLANEDNDRVLVDDPWFWFIQSGVNFAEPGWIVYATSSTYLENVTIDKTLTVIGEDKSSTIIDARGSESVVLVECTSYVNVSGFTVKNGSNGYYLNNSNYCILEDNNITTNINGVNIIKSPNIIVKNNTISNDAFGIYLFDSNYTEINNNDINNCTGGVSTYKSSNITIEYNTMSYNAGGIRSNYSSSIVRYNDISYNVDGIAEIYYSNTTMGNNTITHNNHAGITNAVYSNITIDNNSISFNQIGVLCSNYAISTITFNNITFNTFGIESYSGSNATIHLNNIENNDNFGVYNDDSSIILDAKYNWWGDVDGPSPPPNYPSGYGDKVSPYVDYSQWKTNSIEEAGPQ